jgi:cell division protein FtsN
VPSAAKKTNTSNTQFDFYNMLPANQVSAPTATDQNAAQTTNDNVAHPSAPPNPAKVNSILSGVTPPTANANANNLNVNASNNNTSNTQNNNSHQNTVSANSVDDNGDIISVPKNTSTGNTTSTVQAKNNSAQPNTSSAYIIQLAAFLHYQQADQFKAQLALSGYEAKVVAFQKNGKTLQRVWIGPYPSLTAAAAVQRQLATNQIKSTLLKVNSQ